MELGFADPWDSTQRFEGFQNIPPKCLKQYSGSVHGPWHPRQVMATPRRLSSRAPWTRAAQNARTRQLFSVCARVCPTFVHGGGHRRPIFHIQDRHLAKISCLPRSHKQAGHWRGTAPSLPCGKGFGLPWLPFFNAVPAP